MSGLQIETAADGTMTFSFEEEDGEDAKDLAAGLLKGVGSNGNGAAAVKGKTATRAFFI